MELRVFTDIFHSVRERRETIMPAVITVVVAIILNLVILETISPNFSWIPFAFEVFKWAVAFTLSGLTALSVRFGAENAQGSFSKIFVNLFVFSVFMAFFVVVGYGVYTLPGMLVLFFTMYAPAEMARSRDFDILSCLKGNFRFILDDAHIIHTFIMVLIVSLLVLVPYAGDYLSLFFYTLWVPYVYEKLRETEEQEPKEDFE